MKKTLFITMTLIFSLMIGGFTSCGVKASRQASVDRYIGTITSSDDTVEFNDFVVLVNNAVDSETHSRGFEDAATGALSVALEATNTINEELVKVDLAYKTGGIISMLVTAVTILVTWISRLIEYVKLKKTKAKE